LKNAAISSTDQADGFRLINPTKRNLRENEKARKPAFRLINPAATPFEREQRPNPGILPKKQLAATEGFTT
jgi:hypothetical protein